MPILTKRMGTLQQTRSHSGTLPSSASFSQYCESVLLPMKVLVTQSCLTLCGPMDCSPPGSSVHGNLQARIVE